MTFWSVTCLCILGMYVLVTALDVRAQWPLRTRRMFLYVATDFVAMGILVAYVLGAIR